MASVSVKNLPVDFVLDAKFRFLLVLFKCDPFNNIEKHNSMMEGDEDDVIVNIISNNK